MEDTTNTNDPAQNSQSSGAPTPGEVQQPAPGATSPQTPSDTPQDDSTAPVGNALDEIFSMEPTEAPPLDQERITSGVSENGVSGSKESKRIRWRCRNCQYQYEGYEKLSACPRCGKDPSYFEDVD